MVENNPHKISTMGQGGSLAGITDASDFPHTGLIKGLSQMARQNLVVKNNSNDFDITQSTANGGTVSVSAGTYLRDGKKYVAQYKTGTTSASFTFNASELITTYDKGYHLVVVDENNFILIRKPTAANKVPDYTSGDTIIAIVEYSSTTSSGARNVQYLTTDKTENSVSIAYENSNAYTEVSSITGTSDGLFISGIGSVTPAADGSDKVIIQDANASDVIKSVTVAQINALAPQGDITGITAGTNLSGGGSSGAITLNVDDAFLINSGDDTTTGTITAGGFTTAGSITLGGHAFNDIDIGSEFTDADDHLMSAGAIKEKIEGYGYTTNVGDITGVDLTEGTGIDITEANTASGDYTATINLDLTEVIATDAANRVLTSDGDGTLTAQAELLVVEGLVSIEKALALGASGVTQYDGTTSLLVVDASSNSSTITLPSAASIESRVIIIKNVDTSNLTVTTQSSDKFEDNRVGEDYRQTDVNNLKLRPLESVMLYAISDSFSVDGSSLTNGYLIIDREYEHPNHTGEVTSTADGATVIASNVVDEDNLKVSNSPTNGYFLQAQSGAAGGLTWAAVSSSSGDIEGITTASNSGLAGGATTGTPSLSLDINNLTAEAIASGDTIAFNDSGDNGIHKETIDDIATLFAGDGLTASSAVIAVNVDDSTIETNSDTIRVKNDGINTQHIADDAVDGDKLADSIIIADTLEVTGTTTLLDSVTVAPTKTFSSTRLPTSTVSSGALTETNHAGRYLICGGNVTLPSSPAAGVHFTILNTSGGDITVTATNSSTINGGSANTVITVADFNAVTCIGIGSNNWIALGV